MTNYVVKQIVVGKHKFDLEVYRYEKDVMVKKIL